MEKALSNITVLDLTRVLAGPYCTMMLADYGANVIKIEMPGKGDDTRAMGPKKNDYSMYYAYVNRGKKGITLNLKSEEGKKLFLEMVKKADVVVENYRPGVMDKLGVGYDVLKEVNDQIIYAAVSGFGCYGPKHQRPGYDIIAQATSGLMSITGEAGGQPLRVGNAMGDVLGGMNLTIGILMALNARTVTGRGQRVDVALVDSVVSSLEVGWQRFFASGKQPELIGNRYASAFPYDSFQASSSRSCAPRRSTVPTCSRIRALTPTSTAARTTPRSSPRSRSGAPSTPSPIAWPSSMRPVSRLRRSTCSPTSSTTTTSPTPARCSCTCSTRSSAT